MMKNERPRAYNRRQDPINFQVKVPGVGIRVGIVGIRADSIAKGKSFDRLFVLKNIFARGQISNYSVQPSIIDWDR